VSSDFTSAREEKVTGHESVAVQTGGSLWTHARHKIMNHSVS
jgi:hypothetical protein